MIQMSKVIDLSTYNTVIDWSKVKQNVDGVIIRCAYRGYGSGRIVKDKKSDNHAANCKVQGIPCHRLLTKTREEKRQNI